jgi:hypothetical protein
MKLYLINLIYKLRLNSLIFPLYLMIRCYFWQERKISYGENNPGKTIYIIRMTPYGAGLFANVRNVLSHIDYARKKGYLPVVDWQNYKTYYNESIEINGTNNAWEYYFEQPDNISISQAYSSKNVILSCGCNCRLDSDDIRNVSDYILNNRLNDLVIKNKLRLSKYVEQEVRANSTFLENKKVLGVKARGTDYHGAKQHYKQSSIIQIIENIDRELNNNFYDLIYLTTEDDEILKSLVSIYGDKIVYTNSLRFNTYQKDKMISNQYFNRENTKYLAGLEYIIDLYLLSNCQTVISSMNNGLIGSILLRGKKYEKLIVIDNGLN